MWLHKVHLPITAIPIHAKHYNRKGHFLCCLLLLEEVEEDLDLVERLENLRSNEDMRESQEDSVLGERKEGRTDGEGQILSFMQLNRTSWSPLLFVE